MSEIIYVDDRTGDNSLPDFLRRILCTNSSKGSGEWEYQVRERSPKLAAYIIKAKGFSANGSDYGVRIHSADSLLSGPLSTQLNSQWVSLLQEFATAFGEVCVAGGAHMLAEALIDWVKEKTGRKLEITFREDKIVLEGAVSPEAAAAVGKMLQDKFGPSA